MFYSHKLQNYTSYEEIGEVVWAVGGGDIESGSSSSCVFILSVQKTGLKRMSGSARGSLSGKIIMMERALSSSHRENESLKDDIQKFEDKLARVEETQASFRFLWEKAHWVVLG